MHTNTVRDRYAYWSAEGAKEHWTQVLRLSEVEVTRMFELIEDARAPERLEAVREKFRDKRVLQHACRFLHLDVEGTVAELQARVAERPHDAAHLLLIARFGHRKLQAAIDDVVYESFFGDDLETLRAANGIIDRTRALISLLYTYPGRLARVRVLDTWHRMARSSLVISDKILLPKESMDGFFTKARVKQFLATEFPDVHLDVVMQREQGQMVFLHRNLRPSWQRDAAGTRVQHGYEEEFIALHFLQGGRMVHLSATTGRLAHKIAEGLAGDFFGQPIRYVEDLRATSEAAIQRLVTTLLDSQDERLALVESVFDNSSLPGSPRIILTDFTRGDIAPAVHALQMRVGPLFDDLDHIPKLKVSWRNHRVPICFPVIGGIRVVQFWDSRIDNNTATRFAAFMLDEFGIEVRSVETGRA